MKSRLTASIGAHPMRWGFLLGSLFCTAIGAILSLAMEGALVGDYFTVSYCIGLAVLGCTELGVARAPAWLPPGAVRLVMAVCGLVVGLAVGGVLIAGNPVVLLGDRVRVLIGALVCALAGVGVEALKQVWSARAGLDQAERDRLTRDKTLAEAELRVLQGQVEPHFLFNSLANASSLIRKHPDRAARLLERLTSLLRVSLSRTRRAAGTLGDELAVVRAYLDIQALRMAGRMTYDVQVDPGLESAPMPPHARSAAGGERGAARYRAVGGGWARSSFARRVTGDSLRIRVTDIGGGLRQGADRARRRPGGHSGAVARDIRRTRPPGPHGDAGGRPSCGPEDTLDAPGGRGEGDDRGPRAARRERRALTTGVRFAPHAEQLAAHPGPRSASPRRNVPSFPHMQVSVRYRRFLSLQPPVPE